MNDVAQEFNNQLEGRVTQLRALLPQARLTCVDASIQLNSHSSATPRAKVSYKILCSNLESADSF